MQRKTFGAAFLRAGIRVHGLDSYPSTPVGDIVSRFANGGVKTPDVKSCGLGQTMSGVIVAMRRTLLSCTSLARYGVVTLAAAIVSAKPAKADESALIDALSSYFDLSRQELAVLTTALALLGFSVLAAILLMRTRVRAA